MSTENVGVTKVAHPGLQSVSAVLNSAQRSSTSMKIAHPRPPDCVRCVPLRRKLRHQQRLRTPGLQSASAMLNCISFYIAHPKPQKLSNSLPRASQSSPKSSPRASQQPSSSLQAASHGSLPPSKLPRAAAAQGLPGKLPGRPREIPSGASLREGSAKDAAAYRFLS